MKIIKKPVTSEFSINLKLSLQTELNLLIKFDLSVKLFHFYYILYGLFSNFHENC
jgi:hypothetical protein